MTAPSAAPSLIVHNVHGLRGLLWRPAMVWLLFPLFWAVAWPLLSLAEGGTPVRSLWTGESTAAERAVWHLIVLVPAVMGLAVASARLEFQHAPFTWVLPGARRGLLAGTLLIAMTVAAVLAVVAGRTMPAPHVVAGFALSLLSFTVASAALDVALPRAARWGLVGVLALAAVRPGSVSALVEWWPSGLAVAAISVTAILLRVQFSKRSARLRHFRWSAAAPGPKALYWAGWRGVDRDWGVSLATGRLGPWLRAVEYEGGKGRGLIRDYVLAATFAVAWGHLTSSPGMVLIVMAAVVSTGRPQLSSTLVYPLSRAQRARLVSAGSVLEAAGLTILIVVALLAVHALGIPVLAWFAEDAPRVGWVPVLAMAWALAPIAQWPGVRAPLVGHPFRMHTGWIVPFLVYLVTATAAALIVVGQAPVVLGVATVVIALVTHVGHWALVRRHYTHADLAPGASPGGQRPIRGALGS